MWRWNCVICCGLLILALSMCSDRIESEPKITVVETEISLDHIDAPKRLSEFDMFDLPLSDMSPKAGVELYTLNSSLFSDYAYKKRFIHLPEGTAMTYHGTEAFDFPEGSYIFKFFYYPHDFNKPDGDKTIMETRVLIKQNDEWIALPYVWNEDQTDAELSITGEDIPVAWVDESGEKQELVYETPNMNDCKSCHEYDKKLIPIGPTARHLNKLTHINGQDQNQLEYLRTIGWITGMPAIEDCPDIANWEDPESGTLDARARAYLDINCGYCHHPSGPAKNSALHLHAYVDKPAALGIGKTPIAAGRGSGGKKYDIEPGNADASIMVYRMASDEPGVMMPEIGRKLIHSEGVDLIAAWIDGMQ